MPKPPEQNFTNFEMCLSAVLRNKKAFSISCSLLLIVALLDGLSIATILPLLELATNSENKSWLSEVVEPVFVWAGVDPSLEFILILLLSLLISKAAVNAVSAYQIAYVTSKIIAEYRGLLIEGIANVRWQYFSSQPTGDIANSIVSEAKSSGQVYSFVCQIFSCSIQAVIYFTTAIVISLLATGASLVAGIAMIMVLSTLVTRSKAAGKIQTELLASFSSNIVEFLEGIKPLKAMGLSQQMSASMLQKTNSLRSVFVRLIFLKKLLESGQEVVRAIALASTVYVVIVLYDTSFEALAVIALLFVRTLDVVGKFQKSWQALVVIGAPFQRFQKRLDDLKNYRALNWGREKSALTKGIEFVDVSFKYEGIEVFKNLNLTLPAGKAICICGQSGIGKSTLLDMLLGLLEPTSGKILVDGHPRLSLSKDSWSEMIGYVPQEIALLNDTIFANVALRNPSVSSNDVKQALSAAGATSMISEKKGGIYQVLGERGGKISGGQRQRISIARALVRRPKLLVLDEATSSLDKEIEREIIDNIFKLAPETTVVCVTHQPSLKTSADCVLELTKAENGTDVSVRLANKT